MAVDPFSALGSAAMSGVADLIGGFLNNSAKQKASKQAYKRAKEFAQTGIQWKVSDANAAGINPYFALGAPTATYTDAGIGAETGYGDAVSNFGSNIGRALLANRDPEDKVATAVDLKMSQLGLERAGLENDYLRAKIASELRTTLQPGSPPGIPAGMVMGDSVKGNRLSSGGTEIVRDASGAAWIIPPAVEAQYVENKLGETAGDVVGGHSAATTFLQRMAAKGIWPGVLGY